MYRINQDKIMYTKLVKISPTTTNKPPNNNSVGNNSMLPKRKIQTIKTYHNNSKFSQRNKT